MSRGSGSVDLARRLRLGLCLLLSTQSPVFGQPQGAPAPVPQVWFVQAGASGNGLAPETPLGSAEQAEAMTGPGDIIFLLPATTSLAGGLALKPGQVLWGVPDGSRYPTITNTTADRNDGVGVVLADGVRVEGVEIRDTWASGMLGVDVGDVTVSDVQVENANTGRGIFDGDSFPIPVPHGGIALMASRAEEISMAVLSRVRVQDAAGFGIGAMTLGGATMTIHLLEIEVRGGVEVGRVDYGVAAFTGGSSSSIALEMTRSTVRGRMSRVGRNVILVATDGASARGLIDGSLVGESGQDGVIANVNVPGTVELTIIDSTIENAAQSNIEGTMGAAADEDAVRASRMDVSIHRSTIRGAGSLPGFEEFQDRAANINMTGSFGQPDVPLSRGRYRLRVTDSVVESSSVFGLRIGTPDTQRTVDPGAFDVLVRSTRFEGNERADVMLGASNAQVDARGNCWMSPGGAEGVRVVTFRVESETPIDASQPMLCGE